MERELLSEVKATSFCQLSQGQGKECNCTHWYYAIHGGLLQSLHQHGHNHHHHLFQRWASADPPSNPTQLPDWVRWSDNVGSMPLLHWYCYSFLKGIFNCFFNFATDFGNGNIMTEARLITELNMSTLKNALTVFKTFCSQIDLHQATTTAIMVMPGSITAYTVNPWNNTQASRPRKDEKNSLANGAS